jgi:hypothetical protein
MTNKHQTQNNLEGLGGFQTNVGEFLYFEN